jgi:uncharacterized protein YgfB (UPF0149 family)
MQAEYSQLETFVDATGFDGSAAQLHGQLCGLVAAGLRLDAGQWQQVAGSWAVQAPDQAGRALLENLRANIHKALASQDFSFELMLPDDPALPVQARALADWCAGFLFGIGNGIDESQTAEGDVHELLLDIQRFSQLEVPEMADEESEKALLEISEYLRVAVMNLYLRFDPAGTGHPGVTRH